MAVPDFQTLMRPVVETLSDGGEHSVQSVRAALAERFALSEEDLAAELPSGRAKTFNNRVGWATTYLYRTGLIQRPRRSIYAITERGRTVLSTAPERIDLSVLSQFEEFQEFRRARGRPEPTETAEPTGTPTPRPTHADEDAAATPEERVDSAYEELRTALAADLLDRILEQPPSFFEDLVLDVLQKMGYGGTREDAMQRLGRTGDEGVDGVIREDRLGLDLIFLQAKRWSRDRTLGRPEIQRFVGALQGQRATKGVFITTSTFSPDAVSYAETVTPRVILVDGQGLAELMIDYGVGVTVQKTYEVKKVDQDYFVDEDDGAPAPNVEAGVAPIQFEAT